MEEDATSAAALVVHDDSATARLWFETIAGAYEAAGEDASWDQFVSELNSAVSAESSLDDDFVTIFVDHVGDYSDPIRTVAELADPSNLDEAVRLHDEAAEAFEEEDDDEPAEDEPVDDGEDELVGEGEDEPVDDGEEIVAEADTVEFDQDAWFKYLKDWDGGWDGTEDSWSGFRAGFLAHAPDGSRSTATQMIDHLGDLSVDGRIEELASYGINVTPSDVSDAESVIGEPAEDDEDLGIAALMNNFMDEDVMAQAVESGDLRFEAIEDDELDLSAIN